jgi:hypothetical protein
MFCTATSDGERLKMAFGFVIVVKVNIFSLDCRMFDVKQINENIRVGNGNFLTATKIDSLSVESFKLMEQL